MPITTHDMPIHVRQNYEPIRLDFDQNMLAIYPVILKHSQKLKSCSIIPSAAQYNHAMIYGDTPTHKSTIYHTNAIMLAWFEPFSAAKAEHLISTSSGYWPFNVRSKLIYHLIGHVDTKGNNRLYITTDHIQHYIGEQLSAQLEWTDDRLLEKIKTILTPLVPPNTPYFHKGKQK